MAVSQGCTWNATSGANWINVAPASGSGNGSITLSVGVNSGPARTGTVTVASQTVSIEQRATAPCTYAIKPTSYNAGKGPDTINVNVTAGTGCAWTTRSDAAWVTIESGGGSGNGTVRLSIPPNPSAERSTVLTIADQPFNLHQDGGCSYSLKPNHYRTGKRADDITIDVNTDTGCSWTASSPVNWVTVAEGASGTGKGKVRLLVAPNDGPSRTVVLTIAGEPFEIRQDGRD